MAFADGRLLIGAVELRLFDVRIREIINRVCRAYRIICIAGDLPEILRDLRFIDIAVPAGLLAVGVFSNIVRPVAALSARNGIKIKLFFRGRKIGARAFENFVDLFFDVRSRVKRRASLQTKISSVRNWLAVGANDRLPVWA